MRLFIAILLSDRVREYFQTVQGKIEDGEMLSPTKPENLHITVKFLGEVADGDMAKLSEALINAKLGGPFVLRPVEVHAFPPRRPTVVAARLEGDLDAAAELAAAIDGACESISVPPEGRSFHPHVTLARPKGTRFGFVPIKLTDGPSIAVDSVSLMQSEPSSAGPHYTPLANFPLKLQ